MKKVAMFSLPCPSTAAIESPVLVDGERGLVLSLVCDDDGQARPSTVLFVKPRAFRKREETYCTAWHLQDTYDTVCEIIESGWVAELRGDAVAEWRDRWMMRHFIIYVDGFGCLEVVGESVLLEDGARNTGGT